MIPRSTQLVNDVFRVCRVVKRVRPNGTHCFTVTLTDGVSRYEAIAGGHAAALVPGELIYVRGCILHRRGEPVLVASSVRPVNHQALHQLRGNENGNEYGNGARDDHTVRVSRD